MLMNIIYKYVIGAVKKSPQKKTITHEINANS